MASLFSLTKELGGCGDPRAFVDFIAENPVTRQKIQIKAMVDTGSVNCGIRGDAARSLGLVPYATSELTTAENKTIKPNYKVNLILPNYSVIPNLKATEFTIGENFNFILGMNFLRYCDISFSNTDDKSIFSIHIPLPK